MTEHPNLNPNSSSILQDLIQKGREHNDELSAEEISLAFPGRVLSREDLDQIQFILQANQIHVRGNLVPAVQNAGGSTEKELPFAAAKPASAGTNEQDLSLEELLAKLDGFIGLDAVKTEIRTTVNMIRIAKERKEHGLVSTPTTLHMVFSGNPGTGKTTIARLVGRIYKKLGVLSTGQFIEADRSTLVGRYVGETESKTREVIDTAMGGMLFIDEAYSLARDTSGKDFGIAAIDVLIKAMEDHRDDFAVIVAGYPDLMEQFLAANPGLRSRFSTVIHFPDYTPKELTSIFLQMCQKEEYTVDTTARICAEAFFRDRYANRRENFANARDVRNYFEKAKRNQANRLIRDGIITTRSLEGLMLEDVQDITLD